MLGALRAPSWRWAGADGLLSRSGVDAVRPSTTARIASVTKTFTAAAVLRLAEDGRLALDDSMSSWASPTLIDVARRYDFRPERITVEHLLRHTSGLPDWGSDPNYDEAAFAAPERQWSRLDQVRWALERLPAAGVPGEKYCYSDTGYVILGDILERCTRLSLAGALRSLLKLDDLGLASLHLEVIEPRPTGIGPAAHQYVGEVDVSAIHASFDLWGGGGLVASMPDLAEFYHALFNGGVFRFPETLRAMLKVSPESGADRYALGIRALPLEANAPPTSVWWGHVGFWGTVAAHDPGTGLSVATTMTRRPVENIDERFALARALIHAARRQPAPRLADHGSASS